jgi:hypothetical protein
MDEVMKWMNQGLAVVALIAIAIGGWRGCSVLFQHVVLPVKDTFVRHIDGVNEYMVASAKSLESTSRALEKISTDITSIRGDMERVHEGLEDVRNGSCRK